MNRFTLWLSSRLIRDHRNVNDLKVRTRYGMLEGWTSIVGNTVLFIIKLLAGLSIHSISLIADAVHTLSDTATSVVILIGFKLAKKPSDREHPFGHGRVESVATLVVAVLLFLAGVEFLHRSIDAITDPTTATAPSWVIALIVLTVLLKELMARFAYQLGDIIDSKALKADALHHRSDVYATALVVVALVSSRYGYTLVDGIMGVFVAIIVFYSAYSIAKEAIDPLLGEAPSRETLTEIERLAKSHDGVLGIHDIIYHKYGQTSIISLHLEVSDKESASRLHQVSEEVEEAIARKMGGVVITHIDPLNKEHPEYEAIARAIEEILSEEERVSSFHELRIIGCRGDRCKVVFDITLNGHTDDQESYDIVRSFQDAIEDRFPGMKAVIRVDPEFSYNLPKGRD